MTGSVVALVLAMATTGDAPMQNDANEEGGAIVLRAFGGAGNGIAAEAWPSGSLIRLEADLQALWPGEVEWGGLAGVIPLAGDRRRFVGLRGGRPPAPLSAWQARAAIDDVRNAPGVQSVPIDLTSLL